MYVYIYTHIWDTHVYNILRYLDDPWTYGEGAMWIWIWVHLCLQNRLLWSVDPFGEAIGSHMLWKHSESICPVKHHQESLWDFHRFSLPRSSGSRGAARFNGWWWHQRRNCPCCRPCWSSHWWNRSSAGSSVWAPRCAQDHPGETQWSQRVWKT